MDAESRSEQENKFEELLDETDRSKALRKNGILLFSILVPLLIIGFFFGVIPGIGIAILFGYTMNKILEKPRRRKKFGDRSLY